MRRVAAIPPPALRMHARISELRDRHARMQDLTAPAVAAMGGACRWNDRVEELARAAGLQPMQTEQHLAGLLVSVEASPS